MALPPRNPTFETVETPLTYNYNWLDTEMNKWCTYPSEVRRSFGHDGRGGEGAVISNRDGVTIKRKGHPLRIRERLIRVRWGNHPLI
jgi:hypothetical protein